MKKITLALLFAVFTVFAIAPAIIFAGEASKRQEFISEKINPIVEALLKDSEKDLVGEQVVASKKEGAFDHRISFYDTKHGLLLTLLALTPKRDENGQIMQDLYIIDLVAVVFVDKEIIWYKSENARVALRSILDVLMKKQSI